MMKPVQRVIDNDANPVQGRVVYDHPKLIWHGGMIGLAVVFAPLTFSLSALMLFVGLTYLSLLIGHSVGYIEIEIQWALYSSG